MKLAIPFLAMVLSSALSFGAADDAAKMGAEKMNPGSAMRTVERIGGGEFKVFVYGNSIALHGPLAKIGWTNNWGMAASAPENDFAHLVVTGLAASFARVMADRCDGVKIGLIPCASLSSANKTNSQWGWYHNAHGKARPCRLFH